MDRHNLICACALHRHFALNWAISRRLDEEFDTPSSIFELKPDELAELLNVAPKHLSGLFETRLMDEAEAEVEWMEENDIQPFYIREQRYPKRLRECPDAPLMLFVKGNCNLNASRMIAFVGTRASTPAGRSGCSRIITELSALRDKPVIVSGLAYGIDACAHETAIECGLPTIAVMGTSFETVHPSRNRALAERIAGAGAVVTDFSKGNMTQPVNFVSRNRIIAGMCDATVVCESKAKGGGLITAEIALSYSREVFAIPGRLCDITFEGCNRLIETQGARIATGGESIIEALEWKESAATLRQMKLPFYEESPIKNRIIRSLRKRGQLDAMQLESETGIEGGELALALLELEMDGRVALYPGNRYGLI